MSSAFQKIKQEGKEFRNQIRQQTLSYIVAALSLVAGLAWNDAIKDLITRFFPESKSLWARFLYAVVITFIVILATFLLSRLLKKHDTNQNEQEK